MYNTTLKLVLLLILLKVPVVVHSPPHTINVIKFDYTQFMMNLIESHEGRMYTKYECPAGYSTTGLGHIITHKDRNLRFPISDNEVDSIFKEDLRIRLVEVNRLHSNLDTVQQYAIAYFMYIFGNVYYKSRLRQLVSTGFPIGDELAKYNSYRKKGDTTYIKSTILIRTVNDINRIYEGTHKDLLGDRIILRTEQGIYEFYQPIHRRRAKNKESSIHK